MLFNIDINKILERFEKNTDYIPLYVKPENGISPETTIFINKNIIIGFSHSIIKERECLSLKFDLNKLSGYTLPRHYIVCKDDNPVAFNKLFKGLPEKLSKYDSTSF